jgi:hypothetical protein
VTEPLEIRRLWTINTCHITGEDANALGQCEDLGVEEYREGFWVAVPDDFGDGILETLTDFGFSPSVGHILSVAHSHEIDFVRIDADGPICAFLHQYHW